MRMSVQWVMIFAVRIATTPLAVTHVAVILDILSTVMDTHVMVIEQNKIPSPLLKCLFLFNRQQ